MRADAVLREVLACSVFRYYINAIDNAPERNMKTLTANEQALETLMHEAANLPRTRGACKWATINGREIMCAPTYNADGSFRSVRFVVDGQSMKARDLWAAVRA